MTPSLLLTKLPPELRTLIWEFTLQVPPTNANDNHEIVWLTSDPRPRRSVLSLLLTCRQINREAADIFYRINRLAIDVSTPNEYCRSSPGPARDPKNTIGSLAQFLKSLSPGRLSAVHSLCIWLDNGYKHIYGLWTYQYEEIHTVYKRLRRVPNLRTLHLMWDQPDKVQPSNREAERLQAERSDRGIVLERPRPFPPKRQSHDSRSAQRVVVDNYHAVFKTLQLLRQVEEVTVWGRDASQEDDPWLAKAMQMYLPRYRAKHGIEWVYSRRIGWPRYMCSHGCEAVDCEHLRS